MTARSSVVPSDRGRHRDWRAGRRVRGHGRVRRGRERRRLRGGVGRWRCGGVHRQRRSEAPAGRWASAASAVAGAPSIKAAAPIEAMALRRCMRLTLNLPLPPVRRVPNAPLHATAYVSMPGRTIRLFVVRFNRSGAAMPPPPPADRSARTRPARSRRPVSAPAIGPRRRPPPPITACRPTWSRCAAHLTSARGRQRGSGRRQYELEVAICWANDTIADRGRRGRPSPAPAERAPAAPRLEPCAGGAISVAFQPVADSVSDHAPDGTDPETTPPTWIANRTGAGRWRRPSTRKLTALTRPRCRR